MEMKWLEDFVSLANTRSFSKSAEQRNVTQPAFSRRIRALENWLGILLFDRSTYPTTLTGEGRAFRETAEQTLLLLNQARDDFRQLQSRARATISISVLHGITLTFLPGWLKLVQSQTGPISVRIDPGNFHDCVQDLVDGDCDLLLTYSCDTVPVLLDPQLYPSVKLAGDVFLPVSATGKNGQPLYQIDPASPKPLPWLNYGTQSFLGRAEELIVSRQKPHLDLQPVFESPMGESLKAMALEGYGVAWLTRNSVDNELADNSLVVVGGKNLQMSLDISIYRSTQKARPQLMQFWNCVEELSEMPGKPSD